MTLNQFLAKLAATPRNWCLTPKGTIRDSSGCCPIVAVTAKNLDYNGYAVELATMMGLSRRTARNVVYGADWDASQHKGRMRKRLLKACGLTEVTQ
jgi:hypothetical protein